MKRKNMSAVLLASAMMLTLMGCSRNTEDAVSASSASSEEVTASPITITRSSEQTSESAEATSPEDSETESSVPEEATIGELTIPEGAKVATINAPDDGVVRARSTPSKDENVIGYLCNDDQFEVIEELDGWYKLKTLEGDAYVDSNFVTVTE